MSAASPEPEGPINRVLARLAQVTGREPVADAERIGRWKSDCPMQHEGEANTLSTYVAADGRVLFLCWHRCASKDIAHALDLDVSDLYPVQRDAAEAPKTRWRLDELLEDETIMQPPPVIVPRLAWSARSTLLVAREKAGKSTLTGYITACVSNGSEFLGETCERGDVLVIGLEEFIGDTARRLRDFGADPTRVYLVDRFLDEPALRPKEFRAHLEAVHPVLVIVDSFSAYGHGQISDENNASEISAVVQPLTDVAHQCGVALILIHHATKSTGKSRGSTAITAGVDVVVEFEAPEKLADTDPTLRAVRSVGRVPVPRYYEIRYEDDQIPPRYSISGNGDTRPLALRILSFVRDNPSCSERAVIGAVKGTRAETVAAEVVQLLDDGRLVNLGTGKAKKLIVPGDVQGSFGYEAGQ